MLSLHDALPISNRLRSMPVRTKPIVASAAATTPAPMAVAARRSPTSSAAATATASAARSEEHTSELQSLMRTSYAVFCLKKKKTHLYQYTKLSHYTYSSTYIRYA